MPRASFHSVLLFALVCNVPCMNRALAQDAPAAWIAETGDAWMDDRLADINRYAQRYPATFADELARYFALPRASTRALLAQADVRAGDVYFACALARIAEQPCTDVLRTWRADHAAGWSGVEKTLGITRNSALWHQLKVGVVNSYDRWGRPIAIDRDLRTDFPKRPSWRGSASPVGANGEDVKSTRRR